MTSRVFIPQYPMHWRPEGKGQPSRQRVMDLAPAQDYGEVIELLPGKPELNPARVLPLLREGLRTFDEQKDYFLTIGHPILIAWTGIVLGQYVRSIRFLDWDRDNKIYNVVPLTIFEGETKCLMQTKQ